MGVGGTWLGQPCRMAFLWFLLSGAGSPPLRVSSEAALLGVEPRTRGLGPAQGRARHGAYVQSGLRAGAELVLPSQLGQPWSPAQVGRALLV